MWCRGTVFRYRDGFAGTYDDWNGWSMATRHEQGQDEARQSVPAWRPLRHKVFRALWIATFFSNIGTWMQEVGGTWLMTTLAPAPFMVALMQVATSLPMVLLALPAGTLADIVDRRRLLLVTQSGLCITAMCFGIIVWFGAMTPWLLLGLTGVMSLGLALTSPVGRAITPELVSRDELPEAISLENTSVNIARAVGPSLGGLLLTAVGAAALFLLNALSFLGVIAVFYSWSRPPAQTRLPAEHFWGAMQAGVRYVRHAPESWAVLARAGSFTLCGSALWALLPLLARQELGQDSTGYGLLLGYFGVGAVVGTIVLPSLRQRLTSEHLVALAMLLFAAVLVMAAVFRLYAVLCGVLVAGGLAWLILLSIFNGSIQAALPSWVRGRALAIYVLVFFGGMAGGSALWGAVATYTNLSMTFVLAAAGVVVALLATHRCRLVTSEEWDTTPACHEPTPDIEGAPKPEAGPVLVTIDYHIDPAQAQAFVQAIRRLGRTRRRDGALRWGIFRDIARPGHYLESFVVESWAGYLQQHERFTVADRDIETQVLAFHRDATPPIVSHFIAERYLA